MRKENGKRDARPAGGHALPGRPLRNDRWFDLDASDDRRLKAGPIDSETTQLDVRDVRLSMAVIARTHRFFPSLFFRRRLTRSEYFPNLPSLAFTSDTGIFEPILWSLYMGSTRYVGHDTVGAENASDSATCAFGMVRA